MNNIEDTLKERGSNYGTFENNAKLTQDLKSIYKEHIRTIGKQDLPATHQEAIDMIFHKLSRIANGDHNFLDSWVDIIGYVQLVVNSLNTLTKAITYQAGQMESCSLSMEDKQFLRAHLDQCQRHNLYTGNRCEAIDTILSKLKDEIKMP